MASKDFSEGIIPSGKAAMDDEPDQISRIKAVDRVIEGAKAATEKEQKMTLLQGIRLYPKAIAWSVLVSFCIVMEGYDVCLINNFCQQSSPRIVQFVDGTLTGWLLDAFPQFNRKYGEQLPNGDWEVPAPWQAGLSNVSFPLRPDWTGGGHGPIRSDFSSTFLAVFASSLSFYFLFCSVSFPNMR
jgi:SP family general alpha glucoside:H+ symporter-like MFS transporter